MAKQIKKPKPQPFMSDGYRKTIAGLTSVHIQADDRLASIKLTQELLDGYTKEFNGAVELLKTQHEARIKVNQGYLEADVKALKALMKSNKKALFDGTDIVYLVNGALIYSKTDKVRIPKDIGGVIAICEENGWSDVVKIAKSLDREAVEKWNDARLLVIGAERKPKEEFSYDVKKEVVNGG